MKALALFSGGLDSLLAIKVIQEQGLEVEAITFSSPFFSNKKAVKGAEQLKIKLKTIELKNDYLKLIKKPKFGYGKGMNPCLDCKIFMLKKAKQYAKKIKAEFIFTGEVLNQRPKSQHYSALLTIAKEAGLKNKLLRPLSAKLLPETEAEKKGKIDRSKLLAIQGRTREKQMLLAQKFKLSYPSPSGGCLLCEKEFALKLKDLFKHQKKTSPAELELLKVGRHFRFSKNKMIVGRNHQENQQLLSLKSRSDYLLEVPDIGSPTTLLQGPKTKPAIKLAAQLTARYSDSKEKAVLVKYGEEKLNKEIKIELLTEEEIKELRVK